MSKRATDHLEPSAKKRASDRQLTQDDRSSDEGEEEPGTFQRASEEVLKSRRIVKARRAGEAATQTSEQSGASNPFAKITLTIPGQPGASGRIESVAAGPTSVEASAPSNESSKAAGPTQPEQHKTDEDPRNEGNEEPKQSETALVPTEDVAGPAVDADTARDASVLPAEDNTRKDESVKETPHNGEEVPAASQPAASLSQFTSFATSNSAPFALAASASQGFSAGGGFAFGGFGPSTGNGISDAGGCFGAFGGAQGTGNNTSFSFGSASGSKSTFSFATPAQSSGFPALQTVFGSGLTSATTPLFGSNLGTTVGSTSKVTLPEEKKQVTGEEEEKSVFSSEGVLFQLEGGAWKERGRGEMKCNVGPSGRARLVMRQRGNLRLLLNANLWPDMKIITMDGNKGVTFAVVNAAKTDDGGKDDNGEDSQLLTYALRIKNPSKLAEFTAVVNEHKSGTKQVEENTAS